VKGASPDLFGNSGGKKAEFAKLKGGEGLEKLE